MGWGGGWIVVDAILAPPTIPINHYFSSRNQQNRDRQLELHRLAPRNVVAHVKEQNLFIRLKETLYKKLNRQKYGGVGGPDSPSCLGVNCVIFVTEMCYVCFQRAGVKSSPIHLTMQRYMLIVILHVTRSGLQNSVIQ